MVPRPFPVRPRPGRGQLHVWPHTGQPELWIRRVNQIISSATNGRETGSDAPEVSNKRRWVIVGLLFTASLINYLDRATISFALPLISTDLHLAPATKGLLLSSFFWSYALMQIPIGWCADRFNLRWLYAGAFALWSLAQGLTGFVGSVTMLIGCRVLLGIGEAIYLVGGTKVVSLFFSLSQRGLPRPLSERREHDELGQDQESRLQPGRRAARVLRRPR